MAEISNRHIHLGLSFLLVSALNALLGSPSESAGISLRLWELLLQLQLCNGFVILIVGILELLETTVPDFKTAIYLFTCGLLVYSATNVANALGFSLASDIQLFLLCLSLSGVATGWWKFIRHLLVQLEKATD